MIISTSNQMSLQVRDNSYPNTAYLFSGSENFIKVTQEKSVYWVCQYNMFWYPFDSQTCSMDFFLSTNHAVLIPHNLTYNGPKDLSQYSVKSSKICTAFINGYPGVKVAISFTRRLINNILTVFIPTIILLILSYMANGFQDGYIDMVISVNLTVLLVLTTL